jgi:outer membrane immunogenic protein
MKKIGIGIAAAAVMVGTPTLAADMALKALPPVPGPVFSWTGCYVGINAGGGWGERAGDLDSFGGPDAADLANAVAAGAIPSTFGLRPAGALGGGQIGCNSQTGMWMWGGEADIQAADISDSTTMNSPRKGLVTPVAQSASENLPWFGTFRARLGAVVAPQWLLYASGGLAYGGVHDSASLIATPATNGTFVSSLSQTRVGWTLGAGAEYAISPNLSLRAEYLYIDLGKNTMTLLDPVHLPGDFINYDFVHRENIFRIGLNYRFR